MNYIGESQISDLLQRDLGKKSGVSVDYGFEYLGDFGDILWVFGWEEGFFNF